MNILLRVLFLCCCILHFLALHLYGIATFSTTGLLYLSLYLLLRGILGWIPRERQSRLITRNLRNLLLFLFVIEFLLAFLFGITNTYHEKIIHVYLSDYKKQEFRELMRTLGRQGYRSAPAEGYPPYFRSEHRSEEFFYHVNYNALGFRGPMPQHPEEDSIFQIVVLGDSFAESFGAPEDSTFPVMLQKALQSRHGLHTSVLNAGFCGSDPVQAIALYHHKLKDFPADLVIMISNLADLYDVEYTFNRPHMPVSEYFIASSHVFRLIYWGLLSNDISLKKASRHTAAIRDLHARRLCDSLRAFDQELDARNRQLALVYLPMSNEVLPIPGNIPTTALSESYTRAGLSLIDLTPVYRAEIQTKQKLLQYYWEHDGHHTSRGYTFMANAVADALIEKHLVPVRSETRDSLSTSIPK